MIQRLLQRKHAQRAQPGLILHTETCRRFSLTEIHIATQNFAELLGEGGFGKVYKGFIENREEAVAVKVLDPGSDQNNEFLTEVKLLSRLHHRYLLSLIGYCNEGVERILVYDYMREGTLADHLYENKGAHHIPLSWEKRIEICIGTARGLDYLHKCTDPCVIHRDVKATNILLDKNFTAKIADFGLIKLDSVDQLERSVSKEPKGTFGYLDPKLFEIPPPKPRTEFDVYAFGVVLLVVLSGRKAVNLALQADQHSLVSYAKKCIKKGRLDKITDLCLKDKIQQNSLEDFIKVAEKCLLRQLDKRPSMNQVVTDLTSALKKQQGAVVSKSEEVDHNQLMSDEMDIDSEGDYSGTNNLNLMEHLLLLELSSPEKSLKLHGSVEPIRIGKCTNFEESKNVCGTRQRDDAKPYNPQDVLYQGESSNMFQSPSFEQSIRIFSFRELQAATNNFKDVLKIRKNGFGCYKGRLAEPLGSELPVFVKRCKVMMKPHKEHIRLLKTFSHPNLLKLIGYCIDNGHVLFVHEFMKNSNLRNHLIIWGKTEVPLSWGIRLKICCNVARGLTFLHSRDSPIILGGIKLSEILLDESYNAKVCGFHWTNLDTIVTETFGYMSVKNSIQAPLTVKGDVFYFGIFLAEMITGVPILDIMNSNSLHWPLRPWYHKECKLRGLMTPSLENQYSVGEPNKQISQLALICMDINPKMRPSMRGILQTLENIQSSNMES